MSRAVADILIDSYVDWREASLRVQAAYDLWRVSDNAERGFAYARYLTMLQQEQSAACVYEGHIAQARRATGSSDRP